MNWIVKTSAHSEVSREKNKGKCSDKCFLYYHKNSYSTQIEKPIFNRKIIGQSYLSQKQSLLLNFRQKIIGQSYFRLSDHWLKEFSTCFITVTDFIYIKRD